VAEHATERVVISATPDRCFAVSADLGAYPRWAADIKEVIIDARDEQGRPQLVTFRAAAFGRAGRQRVVDHFSWSSVAARTAELYRGLASA